MSAPQTAGQYRDEQEQQFLRAVQEYVEHRQQTVIVLPAIDPTVLNLEQAADLLQVSTYTLRQEATAGRVPAMKIGNQWRFARSALVDHLRGDQGAA